jgi:lycopene beta-cyclase
VSVHNSCDVAIIGGGLSGGLMALALVEKRPDLDVRVIEREPMLGGNHIWSFFDSDIHPDHRWLIEPLICHRWQGYDVIFPDHSRTIDAVYNAIESERLNTLVKNRLGADHILHGDVHSIDTHDASCARIYFGNDHILTARHAIDARGPGDLNTLELGWQKFVGQSLTVKGGHGLTRPIVKDASVPQLDGYRFVYCLPLDAETVFVEDTYYSDTPDLDLDAIRGRIAEYAASKNWINTGNAREETGVLPVVIAGDFDAYWASTGEGQAKAGLRAGRFHATTGYSLPDAVRSAAALPDLIDLSPPSLAQALKDRAQAHWRGQRFYRMLDTMLFRAAEPEQRYKVLQRFYRLSPALIARFYAGQSSFKDKLRILMGKPPVPLFKAIKAILRM